LPRYTLIVAIGQITEAETAIGGLNIVVVHQSFSAAIITGSPASERQVDTIRATALSVGAAASLHGTAGEGTRHGIGGDAVQIKAAAISVQLHVIVAFGVLTREVEEVDACEDYEEATQERDCVDGVAGVEALEEDKGCDEGAGGEGDVVERVDTRNGSVQDRRVGVWNSRTCWY
jgi:hypothetical protein